MKNSKKNINSAGQSTTDVRKSQKHDANLQKNSTLYFQIGLILCLLGTYSLFEMQFQDKAIVPDRVTIDEVATIDVAPDFRIEYVEKTTQPKTNNSQKLNDVYKEVPDDHNVVEKELFTPEEPVGFEEPVEIESIPEKGPEDDEPVIVPFISIEKVPVYPGCERKKTNEDKRKCMSTKINKLVNRKFNTEIAADNGITGKRKIQTQFTVDKDGNVTDIKIRAPHPALEREARRVIGKIPHMKPGYQRDKPVGVIYNLDINFLVRD